MGYNWVNCPFASSANSRLARRYLSRKKVFFQSNLAGSYRLPCSVWLLVVYVSCVSAMKDLVRKLVIRCLKFYFLH